MKLLTHITSSVLMLRIYKTMTIKKKVFYIQTKFYKLHNKFVYMPSFRNFIELNVFGVCSSIGERFNIASSKIRLYFIYASFLTFGSPVILYFVLAFWKNVKRYVLFAKRNPLRYL